MFIFISFFFFFFTDTATTEIYTLSLHDALPILRGSGRSARSSRAARRGVSAGRTDSRRTLGRAFRRHQRVRAAREDRKSTRLNSSHVEISYAVFCLKKKKKKNKNIRE